MCGIAGIVHRGGTESVGREMTSMLQAMKHRGPDSTGFALYGAPKSEVLVMRFKVAEQEELRSGFDMWERIKANKAAVDGRMEELGALVTDRADATDYAFRYTFGFDGDLKRLMAYIEDIEGVEVLSLGHALELVKDLGDATRVSTQYGLGSFEGTHAICLLYTSPSPRDRG